MDWTDVHFRQLARLISKRTWLWTEMVVDKTIIHSPYTDRHLWFPPEQVCVCLCVCHVCGCVRVNVCVCVFQIAQCNVDWQQHGRTRLHSRQQMEGSILRSTLTRQACDPRLHASLRFNCLTSLAHVTVIIHESCFPSYPVTAAASLYCH